ncbi:hypothetical protein KC336_g48 [Hortaea werneckii]|nr:hypothetical protein KC336_g48 [Hortaea werneckii]
MSSLNYLLPPSLSLSLSLSRAQAGPVARTPQPGKPPSAYTHAVKSTTDFLGPLLPFAGGGGEAPRFASWRWVRFRNSVEARVSASSSSWTLGS